MNKTTFWILSSILTYCHLGCRKATEATSGTSEGALIGKWSLHSVTIEKLKIRGECEKDSMRKTVIQVDTLELNSSYSEFKSDKWKIVISSDSIYSSNSIEDRIRFEWAFQPALDVENEFLSERFHYTTNEDSLLLSNQRIDLHKKVRYFYKFKIQGEGSIVRLSPGIHLDTTAVPSPRPTQYCSYPDSIEWKARLITANLQRDQ